MQTYKLLVLDDDPAILDMLYQSLGDEGYAVATARNGLEGLRQVQKDAYDLILLDLMMPVMDGEQFLTELRASGQPAPPVIIISADRNVSGKIRQLQVAGGLPKPFSLDDLLRQVEQHLPGGAYHLPEGGLHAASP
jgi:DNA-binding response OmpR family regulator